MDEMDFDFESVRRASRDDGFDDVDMDEAAALDLLAADFPVDDEDDGDDFVARDFISDEVFETVDDDYFAF